MIGASDCLLMCFDDSDVSYFKEQQAAKQKASARQGCDLCDDYAMTCEVYSLTVWWRCQGLAHALSC